MMSPKTLPGSAPQAQSQDQLGEGQQLQMLSAADSRINHGVTGRGSMVAVRTEGMNLGCPQIQIETGIIRQLTRTGS